MHNVAAHRERPLIEQHPPCSRPLIGHALMRDRKFDGADRCGRRGHPYHGTAA
jgi:hypothetical protein